MHINTNLQIYK